MSAPARAARTASSAVSTSTSTVLYAEKVLARRTASSIVARAR